MDTGRTPSILQATPATEGQPTAGRWYVVRTNPRCEQRASASMREAGFEVYSPQLRKVVVHHRSKKVINKEFPMLVGYIFVRMPKGQEDFGFVRQCDGVRSFVGMTEDKPTALSEAELDALQELEGSEWLRCDLGLRQQRKLPRHAARGLERVTITTGPLSGFIGHVVQARHRGAVKLITSMFAQLVEITLMEREIDRAA